MYEHTPHRKPARHWAARWDHIRAVLLVTICLTLCLCAEGLADLVINLF